MYQNPLLIFTVIASLLVTGLSSAFYFATEQELLTCYLASVSTSSFFLMGLDKSLSKGKSKRVPEVVLFALSLLGGAAAVLAAIHFFRHKTKKVYFQFMLLIIFAVHILTIYQFG